MPADYVNLHLSETCNKPLIGGSDGASVWMCRHARAGADVDTLQQAFLVPAVYDNRKRKLRRSQPFLFREVSNMNQLALNKRPKSHNPDCADLIAMAERELAAFFSAVKELFGSRQAGLSTEDWLQELMAIDGLPVSAREWRLLTVKVAGRLAGRVRVADEFASPVRSTIAS